MGKAELRIEIDRALLEEARASNIDLAEVTEQSLRRALEKRREIGSDAEKAHAWAAENADAIALHLERIDRFGVFGQDLRRW
ncbi:MAG: type II toxin-antitoxin system CcdA family antitoxin [Alphaproteobacteria bacterium]|nr:type II toxin-antitoxin system CcdA family antitoxin [Alphaproteobacteria bacterium]MBU1525815.1 type II toxin-antitoxin system CcdA family antitoxin [Alphaproteobacteria bacterium]MBU2118307.1 type II toxin-antitoxin system CcdA family antitoxin [Alphaproteobacteria bacterium]MBU2350032.1 type II toxin-antitoxin system CcdA family antitoxin [Alphaproteobacteria bacterium]MBU2383223.1 type II toxin-antitoxin system CcdA family antitoxin [Alphaproteobacteria bacterium]